MAVDVEIDEGIAVVTMNRPQALNAFNSEQLDLLGAAFHALGQDRSVRVVILTGAGDRAFAAGADIKEMVDLTPAEGLAFGRKGQALHQRRRTPAAAGDRRGQWLRLRRRLRTGHRLRYSARLGERPLRAAGGQPGHSTRLGRHATTAPARRTRSRGGDDLHGTPGARRGSASHRLGQRGLPARPADVSGARDGGSDRQQQSGRGSRVEELDWRSSSPAIRQRGWPPRSRASAPPSPRLTGARACARLSRSERPSSPAIEASYGNWSDSIRLRTECDAGSCVVTNMPSCFPCSGRN